MHGDLYAQMGKQLRLLFRDLHDGKMQNIEQEMEKIMKMAKEVGGPLEREAKQLQKDVTAFMKQPDDPRIGDVMKRHALRLEQETREI
ncbi:MAG TPA: hypothetical protein VLE89_04115 [Chlamydiales bacterium]|nr:hypothetical protein [Chlamydiales bacterium]